MKLSWILMFLRACCIGRTPSVECNQQTTGSNYNEFDERSGRILASYSLNIRELESIPPNPCPCGIKNPQRLIGGTETGPHEWPWNVAVYSNSSDGTLPIVAGATLISPEWVLISGFAAYFLNVSDLVLGFGVHDFNQTSAPGVVLRQVDNLLLIPDYYPIDYDIALFHLSQSVDCTNEIHPVCLPFDYVNKNWAGNNATFTGWDLSKNGTTSALMELTMPVLDTATCDGLENSFAVICTTPQGKGPCSTDAGGGLYYQDPSSNRFSVIGQLTLAHCNGVAIYSEVAYYLSWIQNVTGISP